MGMIFSHEVAGYLYLAYWAWMAPDERIGAERKIQKYEGFQRNRRTTEEQDSSRVPELNYMATPSTTNSKKIDRMLLLFFLKIFSSTSKFSSIPYSSSVFAPRHMRGKPAKA
jgi:hypothetical protein